MVVSIITVAYNAEVLVRRTLESVLDQTYRPLEYIIKDGMSEDSTLSIIQSYHKKFIEKGIAFKVISHNDFGIYDAMNRAIENVSGDWVNFMNCGDTFYSSDSISEVFLQEFNFQGIDVIYGSTISKYPWGEEYLKPSKINAINERMVFCHQSSFCKAILLRRSPFDLRYKICADFDFFRRMYTEGKVFYYSNQIIAVYDGDEGFSAQSSLNYIKERGDIRGQSYFMTLLHLLIKRTELFIKTGLNEKNLLLLRKYKHRILRFGLLK